MLLPRLAALLTLLISCATIATAADPSAASSSKSGLDWTLEKDRLIIRDSAGQPVATYVFRDPDTLRPHFQNVHAPDGRLVTRRHPAQAPDLVDHPTMHPGLWMAFGDINGQDFWRNKARIEHVRFIDDPRLKDGRLHFATENRLVATDGSVMGTQISRFIVWREPYANWIVWEAALRAGDKPLVFGAQEEMGLGVRLTGGLIEKNGPGVAVNSQGDRGAKTAWGKVADWCEYSAVIDGRRIGASIFPDPANPQRTWWHVRDYGLMLANSFGPLVLPPEAEGKVTVKPGDELRLRFGVRFFSQPAAEPADAAAAYRKFVDSGGRGAR